MPLWDKVQSIRWTHAVAALAGLVVVVVLAGIGLAGADDDVPPAAGRAAASTRVASPIDANSTRPADNPTLAPNDDPAADSAFGIEA